MNKNKTLPWQESCERYEKKPTLAHAQQAWRACQQSYEHKGAHFDVRGFFQALITLGKMSLLDLHLTEDNAQFFLSHYGQFEKDLAHLNDLNVELFQLNWNIKKRYPFKKVTINQKPVQFEMKALKWADFWQMPLRLLAWVSHEIENLSSCINDKVLHHKE